MIANRIGGKPAAAWQEIKLAELCTIVAPQVDPRSPEYSGLPLISGENVESGNCRLLAVRTAAQEQVISGKYLFEAGDVLYSKLRPYLRKVAVAPFRGLCSADMYPIRPHKQLIEPTFLAWTLLSDEFTQYAVRQSSRARMPKLNRAQLLAWTCRLPSLGEQRRIVSRLRDQLGAVEWARATAEAQLGAAKALPSAYLRGIFEGHEAGMWPVRKVSECCDRIDYGFTAGAQPHSDGPRFLRITDIQDGSVDWERVPGCLIWPIAEAAKKLSDGDIVFARTGGTTGKSFLIKQPPRAVFASYLIRLRPRRGIASEFLYSFFQSDTYWRQVRSSARGGAQPNVNATLLGEIEVPVPCIEDQQRVVMLLKNRIEQAERDREYPSPRLLFRWFDDLMGGKNVVVATVSTPPPNVRHWVVTAFVARRPPKGELEWQRP